MTKECYHCGEEVPANTEFKVEILGEERDMCCPGCESVAQTIVDSGLVSYYQYRTAPAEKADLVPEQLRNLIHYDNEEVQSEFVRQSEHQSEVTLSLEGVSCAACAWLIEKQLVNQQGVLSIRVNTTTNRAILAWDKSKAKLSDLLATVHQLGYKAAPFEADQQEASYHRAMKQYLYRLGIAGLATMQVMMLAVALYLEVFGDLDAEFKQYFRVVSLIFATPVLLYSALPFYMNAWRSLKGRTLGMDVPVSLALIFAYIASLVATVTEQGEVFFESITMFTFFLLLGRFLEMRARRKAAAASANLLKLIPSMATKLDGSQLPVKSLKIGDQVRVLPGEHIPADGVILNGRVHIDESMLTGESIPVVKKQGDMVFAGTLNGEESFELEVNTSKANSMISNIVRLQDEAQMSKPKIAEIADVVARYFVAAILIIAAGTWAYWHQTKPDDAFWIMLAVLVATCPCALSLATPTAITCATSRMGNLGILLRKGHVFETLCKVNHLVVDKTGTLTEGNIQIDRTQVFSEQLTEKECLAIAASLERHANHPIAKAFKTFAEEAVEVTNVENRIGFGIVGEYQNASCKIGSAAFVLGEEVNASQPCVYLSLDNQHVATFYYHDPIRKQSQTLVSKLAEAGVKTTLLTGDSMANAKPVAEEIGIESVVAGATPEDKLAFLSTLGDNEVSLMIGDGINDAPTLAGAHLSVAMGGGADVAKSSADMVLLGDKLDKLIEARSLALKTRKIIRENLAWSLGYNLLILPLAVAGLVAPYIAVVGMSASSIIVVTNSLRLLKENG
ncbi:putative Type cbb3 cytochrome oxidase biogenesis protein CcoI; Copper-translocating P-type ATPase [Vibrio nigripulchritudo SFn27]|uniref:P-type Cu(2+) transporter n=1 Tax=Vibrio nigripulchritudo TaxID=28173 RepID=U4KBV1_9VIBR|nr:heavy metal translocating P-type ATPase [Vibrio nigripulchritudo]CCN84145.1 putative Type cbb3 cytochrome oxidase biogenesis protein CcoI; Copper-translocating P-type ATPase [Vibrio nigripulchritudo BLFn1]CCN87060.1 putative Type cbb3 cytochrome oxidase biogenesis protein CcoI; Copper-translocating P-type ATPase [Vibrio nigripulchritudo SFn27]CCN93235.1 putative Type cbb3 cytochrome oxidase biogenesis protein CcoI; Copper-translocating P-type ATPase [Vibrio nigripulchritudo ENn2]CCO39612.1 p